MHGELTSLALAPAPRDPARTLRVAKRVAQTLALAAKRWRTSSADPQGLRESATALAATSLEVLRIHGIEVVARGRSAAHPAIYVANHISYIDPFLVAPFAPIVAIAKKEVASWPVIGPVAARHGVIFVDRKSSSGRAATLDAAERVLASGTSILNFPEGTTTNGDRLLPFRPGIFRLAQRLRVPVVPVRLVYDDPEVAWIGRDTFVPHYARLAGKRTTEARVYFDRPIAPERFDDPAALAAYAACRIADLPKGNAS